MQIVALILLIVLIVGLAITKIVIEKKKGVKCVGCPHCTSGGDCLRDQKS